jgi:O-antigen ligase
MTTILAIFFGLAFLYLAYRRLDLSFLITAALLPAYLLRFDLGPLPSTALEIMILATFGGWVIRNFHNIKAALKRSSKGVPYPFTWETIAILIIAFIALIPSFFSASALGIGRAYFFEPLLLFIVAANLFIKKKNRKLFVYSLAASALATSIIAIYQKITGDLIANPFWADLATRRVTAWFPYPNALGLFLSPITAILAVMGLESISKKDWKRAMLYEFISLLSLIAIYFAKSDGAIIGLAISAFITLLFWNAWSRKTAIIGAILVFEIIWLSPYKQAAIDKITLFDLSGQIRQQQWKETWQMLKPGNAWIWGAGLDNYQKKVKPYHQDGIFVENHDPDWYRKVVWDDGYKKQVWQPTEIYKYPHNIFLNFWSELGLLGMLLFIWIIGKFSYMSVMIWKDKNNQENRYYGLAGIAFITVIVVHGLVDVPYFKNDLSVFFWIIIALIGIIYIENKKIWKKE